MRATAFWGGGTSSEASTTVKTGTAIVHEDGRTGAGRSEEELGPGVGGGGGSHPPTTRWLRPPRNRAEKSSRVASAWCRFSEAVAGGRRVDRRISPATKTLRRPLTDPPAYTGRETGPARRAGRPGGKPPDRASTTEAGHGGQAEGWSQIKHAPGQALMSGTRRPTAATARATVRTSHAADKEHRALPDAPRLAQEGRGGRHESRARRPSGHRSPGRLYKHAASRRGDCPGTRCEGPIDTRDAAEHDLGRPRT